MNSNQARTKPWPTRPPTSHKNSPITERIRTNETPKCLSTLGDCSRLSKEARRWNSRNQGSSQLTVAYTATSVSLPHEPQIYKQTKKKTPRYQQLFKTSGEVQTKANTANAFRAFLLQQCGCGLVYKRMWVWFRARAHMHINN